MAAKNETPIKPFLISRTFNAPRDLVWKAFTEPERMKEWFGPKGAAVGTSKMDFRVGGTYHYSMKNAEGVDMWGKFEYQEITPQERMVFIQYFSDAQGGKTRHPMSPTWPLSMLSTFTFEEENGKTKVTIEWSPIDPTDEERKTFEEGRDGMNQGWSGTMERLEEYLAKF